MISLNSFFGGVGGLEFMAWISKNRTVDLDNAGQTFAPSLRVACGSTHWPFEGENRFQGRMHCWLSADPSHARLGPVDLCTFFVHVSCPPPRTHLQAAAQGIYLHPQGRVLLEAFVLLLSLVLGLLQSMSQLVVKPEQTAKPECTEKTQREVRRCLGKTLHVKEQESLQSWFYPSSQSD